MYHEGVPIRSTKQNPFHFVNPEELKYLDEHGNFTDKPVSDERDIIANYWARQNKKLGLLLFVSAGILFSILMNETGVVDILFLNVANTIGGIIGGAFNFF